LKKFLFVIFAFVLCVCLVGGYSAFARVRHIQRVYVHVCDSYPSHYTICDGVITQNHSIKEVLDVLDPSIEGRNRINQETVWVFVDSWNPDDFLLVPYLATSIWRTLHQPPIAAFNIDAACLYTETSRYNNCWWNDWELSYIQMRELAIEWERNESWPELEDIPEEIRSVTK